MALTSSVSGTGTITSTGLGSGLDVESIVTKLMEVEKLPVTKIEAKTTTIQAEITAYGTLKSTLSTLQSAAQTLNSASTFTKSTATVGDSTLFTATTDSSAALGSHTIKVTQLAKSQTLQSEGFASASNSLGAGSLTFDFGTYATNQTSGITSFTQNTNTKSVTVTIPAGSDSLSGVAAAINGANAGISASVINDGSQYYLAFSPLDGGSANSLRITAADADSNNTDALGISRLAFDKSTGYSAGSAVFGSSTSTVIDGTNNQFTIALNGGAPITATIGNATYSNTALVTAVQSAVDAALGTGKAKVSLDASNQLQIASADTTPSSQATAVVGNTGLALIGGPKFSGATVAISSAAQNNQFGIALDGGVTKTVTIPDGSYDATNVVAAVQSAFDNDLGAGNASVTLSADNQLVVTSVATGAAADFSQVSGNNGLSLVRGLAFTDPAGGVATQDITAALANNKFNLAVDGEDPVEITIADDTYDATTIVGAFQAAVDEALGAGKAVVSLNTDNQIVVTAAQSAQSGITVAAVTGNAGLSTLFGNQTTSVSAVQNMAETVAPVDAKLIIDGIPVTKSSNVITDAIQGVTLSLLKESATATSLSIAKDTSGIGTNVSGFVTAYNSVSKMLASLLAYDPTTGNAGALQREGTVRSIQSQVSSVMKTMFGAAGLGGINSLTDVGISFQADGSLAFDSAKLDKVLADPTKDIGAFFAGKGGVDGIATKLNTLMTSIVGTGGTIASRTTGLSQSIATYNRQKAAIETRLTTIEARYRQQFTNLDTLIASMSQTSTYLTTQLDNLPTISGNGNN